MTKRTPDPNKITPCPRCGVLVAAEDARIHGEQHDADDADARES
jgi:hypothetical protein